MFFMRIICAPDIKLIVHISCSSLCYVLYNALAMTYCVYDCNIDIDV